MAERRTGDCADHIAGAFELLRMYVSKMGKRAGCFA